MNEAAPYQQESGLEPWTQRLLLAFAFFTPITIALGEALAYGVLVMGAILLCRRSIAWPRRLPIAWPVLVFLAVAVIASLFGVRPEVSLKKLDRLCLLGLLFVIPALWNSARGGEGRWMHGAIAAYLSGCTVQAVCDLVRIPVWFHFQRRAWLAYHPGADPSDAMHLLYNLGNMRDPQFYLVALCLLFGLLVYRCWPARQGWLWLATVANAGGLLLHFKRGAWMSFVLAAVVVGLLTARRKVALVVLLCAVGFLALPPVRERLEMLRREKSAFMGGRLALWTTVAPVLIKEHPMGMGWKAPRHEDFKNVSRNIMPMLNHLHNNLLEILLELGWAGAAAWLWCMGAGAWMGVSTMHRVRAAAGLPAAIAAGSLGGLCGLWANGMVEYNFGDTEIYMMMIFLLAIVAAQWRGRAGPEGAAA